MALTPGSRLGPYEILSAAGAGGMGEVYRARDTRLERIVAVKILPAHLSDQPAARERFDREARAISSLNHPNICHLYDVGSQNGIDYLVMEFLEGESLADRLRRGPLTQDQVLRLGIEICEGLERAHRAGVVHRDLKPGNIMLTKSGVKLLDFGLARSAPAITDSQGSAQETLHKALTAEGTVVGTFQYMSPEQIEGKHVDGRSDLFSLGAVLYEMLTGRRAFEGKSQISIASAILEKEPEPISASKPLTPPALDHAIRTCLAKDPDQRWQTSRDLAHALKWLAEGGLQPGTAGARAGRGRATTWLMLAALVVTTAAALTLGALYLGRTAAPRERVIHSSIRPMTDSSFIYSDGSGFALSPDGRSLVYVGTISGGKSALWLRPIDSMHAEPLRSTEGAAYPFWSADSRSVGYFAGAKLRRIEVAGGPPVTLCDAPDGRGGTWSRGGDILFAPTVNAAIHRVSASGGAAEPVTQIDAARGEVSHRWPSFLPDGRHFLYVAGIPLSPRENPTNAIKIGELGSSSTRVIVSTHAGAQYASGYLLFMRWNTLMAQPFDPGRGELGGEPVPIADPVHEATLYSKGLFSASEDGLLAYLEGSELADRQLLWLDRSGRHVASLGDRNAYASPRISRDGKKVAFYLDATGHDIWTHDIARGTSTPQTFGSGAASTQRNIFPVWSPDGTRVAYASYRNGKQYLYQKPADGSSGEELVLDGADRYRFPTDWSPDGKLIAYQEATQDGWAIWMLPLEGARQPWRFTTSPFSEREPAFSPDGRWLAYSSNESGEYRIYIVPFPGPGGRWQVSPGGGIVARWRRDGREIYYMTPDNRVFSADVSARGSSLEVSAVRPLFETRAYGVFGRFDVSADGQRFIVAHEAGEPTTSITLVSGWPAGIGK